MSKRFKLIVLALAVINSIVIISASDSLSIGKYVLTEDESQNIIGDYDTLSDSIIGLVHEDEGKYTLTLMEDDLDMGDSVVIPQNYHLKITSGENGPYRIVNRRESDLVNSQYHITQVAGHLTLENIIIDGGSVGGGIMVSPNNDQNPGSLTINQGVIIENNVSLMPTHGVIITNGKNSTITMNDGIIRNNHIVGNGGAIRITTNNKLIINGGLITNNYSESTGGAITTSGEFIMNGGRIINNTSDGTGGAIKVSARARLEVNGGIIKDNKAKSGGAISVLESSSNEPTVINNATIENNEATDNGGAIESDNQLIINNSIIENNQANIGGAISLKKKNQDASIINNTKFINNYADIGGAIHSVNNHLNIESSNFIGNNANLNGGALYIDESSNLLVENNTLFEKNKSNKMGGAIFTNDYSYQDPIDMSKYQNILLDNTTSFIKNEAEHLNVYPRNAHEMSNLKFASSSMDELDVNNKVHILNNYDINFESDRRQLTSYNISYHSNVGDEVYVERSIEDLDYTIKDISKLDLENTHYNFVNWNTEADGSGQDYQSDEVIQVNNDLDLYAVWNKKHYVLTFDSKGGSEIASEAVEYEMVFNKPKDPVKESYIFKGWYTSEEYSELYDFSSSAVQDLTIFAKWEAKVSDNEKPDIKDPIINDSNKPSVPKTGVDNSFYTYLLLLNIGLLTKYWIAEFIANFKV